MSENARPPSRTTGQQQGNRGRESTTTSNGNSNGNTSVGNNSNPRRLSMMVLFMVGIMLLVSLAGSIRTMQSMGQLYKALEESINYDRSGFLPNTEENRNSNQQQQQIPSPLSLASSPTNTNPNLPTPDDRRATEQNHHHHEGTNHDPNREQDAELPPPQPAIEVDDMNIVLFYADDWTFRTLGHINPNVLTPNIDEMIRNGVLFRHNCVTTSICWQSRATLNTGLYVAVHGMVRINSETMFNQTVQWPETLFPLLRNHGYHIGFIGKWHHPFPDEFRTYTFDHYRPYYGAHWMQRDGKEEHVTDLNGRDALQYLRTRPRGKKFALMVSFFATHSWDGKSYPDQYMPQPRTEYLYENATIPEPKTATLEAWQAMPWFFTDQNEARNRWRERYNSPERYQVTMKRYYRMATEVDDVVGDVINELRKEGLYNKTLFIFTTDNGMFHGEHQLAGKWYPHEESVRVPLVIQDPRMPAQVRGTDNDEFTLNVDLAPTILAAAGISIPSYMQGRDMAPLYLDRQRTIPTWRKDFFYEWNQGLPNAAEGHVGPIPPVFALIRKDYKYFYWPHFDYEQVFHVEEDPFEEFDIFNSTAQTQPGIIEDLRARYAYLKNWSQSGNPV